MSASLFWGAGHFLQQQAEYLFAPRAIQGECELSAQQPERALQIDALTIHLERQVFFSSSEQRQRFGQAKLLPDGEATLLFTQNVEHLWGQRVGAEER